MSLAEQKILNNYLNLLDHLTPRMKLSLSQKLMKSAKESTRKEPNMKAAFGAWSSDESAEELIRSLQESRSINRDIEGF